MICVNCNNENTVKIFEEEYQCSQCKTINIVEYYLCEECGLICKTIDGEFVNGILLPETDSYEIVEDFLSLGDILVPNENQSMGSFIHKCLQCNTIAYEKEDGLWHCPECGFEWEVIGTG